MKLLASKGCNQVEPTSTEAETFKIEAMINWADFHGGANVTEAETFKIKAVINSPVLGLICSEYVTCITWALRMKSHEKHFLNFFYLSNIGEFYCICWIAVIFKNLIQIIWLLLPVSCFVELIVSSRLSDAATGGQSPENFSWQPFYFSWQIWPWFLTRNIFWTFLEKFDFFLQEKYDV